MVRNATLKPTWLPSIPRTLGGGPPNACGVPIWSMSKDEISVPVHGTYRRCKVNVWKGIRLQRVFLGSGRLFAAGDLSLTFVVSENPRAQLLITSAAGDD